MAQIIQVDDDLWAEIGPAVLDHESRLWVRDMAPRVNPPAPRRVTGVTLLGRTESDMATLRFKVRCEEPELHVNHRPATIKFGPEVDEDGNPVPKSELQQDFLLPGGDEIAVPEDPDNDVIIQFKDIKVSGVEGPLSPEFRFRATSDADTTPPAQKRVLGVDYLGAVEGT